MNLTEAIKAVAPHASKDKLVSVLTGVQIQNSRVMATDRYTLAIVNVHGLDPNVTVWLDPADVKAGVHSVTADLITFTSGATKPTYSSPGDYPAIERLVDNFKPNTGAPEHIESISLDVAHLSKFANKFLPRSHQGAPSFTFGLSNTQPVKVTFTHLPEYIALIVPIKIKEA